MLEITHKNFNLQIDPDMGARIVRFFSRTDVGDRDWFYNSSMVEGYGKNGHRARLPLGFPVVPYFGRIQHGKFGFDGVEYTLKPQFADNTHPIHGYGWYRHWTVVEHTERAIKLHQSSEGCDWPWEYEASLQFMLNDSGLECTLSVQNKSNALMPAGIGLHPYFDRRGCLGLKAATCSRHLLDEGMPIAKCLDETVKSLSVGAPLTSGMDAVFEGWDQFVSMQYHDAELQILASDVFDHLVIYTPENKDYFCVEPMSQTANALNISSQQWDASRPTVLQPNEKLQGVIKFIPKLV